MLRRHLRLKSARRYSTNATHDPSLIRNLAVVAHIGPHLHSALRQLAHRPCRLGQDNNDGVHSSQVVLSLGRWLS
jgi:hypothetical protein